MSEFRRRLMGYKNNQISLIKAIINAKYVYETSSERLLGASFDLGKILAMRIDGIEITPVDKFHFETTGEHSVEYIVADDVADCNAMFAKCDNMIYLDLSQMVTTFLNDMGGFLSGTANLKNIVMPAMGIEQVRNINAFINNSKSISRFDLKGYKANVNNIGYAFSRCLELEYLDMSDIDISDNTNTTNTFNECSKLSEFNPFKGWKKSNLDLSYSPIQPLAVHRLIERASSVAEGATARTLTLNATSKTNWQNSEYYQEDSAMALSKNITIK